MLQDEPKNLLKLILFLIPIFKAVIAIPDKSDKRVRRNALPTVRPCPFVKGKIENFP